MTDNLVKCDKNVCYTMAKEGLVYLYYTEIPVFETVLWLKVKSSQITMRSNPAFFLIIFDIL